MMSHLQPDLTFTVEVEEDFTSKEMPTLDFTLWLTLAEGRPKIMYRFFSKEMATKFCELELGARAWSAKAASLSQDLVRRLRHTHLDLPKDERIAVINGYTRRLLRSGYSRIQTRQCTIGALTTYQRRRQYCALNAISIHSSMRA